jgi:hypothetical protein
VNSRKLFFAFLALVSLGVGISIAGGGAKHQYKPNEGAYYLSHAEEAFLQPGVNLTIQQVKFAPPTVAVTFQITDDNGQGLDRTGMRTPGPLTIGWTIARIRPGDTQYTSYYPIPPNGICQPRDFTDGAYNTSGVYVGTGGGGVNCTYGPGGGTYQDLRSGVYTYTFALQVPANYDANSTTTVGVWASRNLLDFNLGVANANAVYSFVPSGAPVTQVRDIVTTAACNQCHDPLGAHGSAPTDFDRRDVRICILCHTGDKINPETGNTVDEKVFIHKLHMGAFLPSVSGSPLNVLGFSGSGPTTTVATGAQADPVPSGYDPTNLRGVGLKGKPYQIGVTSEGEVFDATTIVWPQDVRNCTTCHQGGTQSDNWKNNPSRAACGSCHDDVNFATGQNHSGGVQTDDSQCKVCHPPDTGLEFDLSVAGAHTMPWKSKRLKGLKVAIISASGKPGGAPTVSFTVTDNGGIAVDASKLDRLLLTVSGPTSDYATDPPWQEDARGAKAGPTGYTYPFTGALPKNAGGTWAVGAEAYRNVTIQGSLVGQSFAVREAASNPVAYFSVDGKAAVPRRKVVEMAKCNVCHETLAHHGNARKDVEYCVLCHNPNHNDNEPVPVNVNFRTMIMRLHMGVAADNTYKAGGTTGTDFGGLRFPADPRNCAKCHVDTPDPTWTVPVPDGLIANIDKSFFYSPIQPTASACLSCHNGQDAAAHAYLQTAPFGESCPVCHQEGADFAVNKIHVRDEIWPPEDAR